MNNVPSRGKPFQPGNRHGKGRPPGSRNKSTALFRAMIEAQGPALIRTMLDRAVRGDARCLQMAMDRLVCRCRENPIQLKLPRIRNSHDMHAAHQRLLEGLTQGQVTIEQAERLTNILEFRRKVIADEELGRRMDGLEQRLQKMEDQADERRAA